MAHRVYAVCPLSLELRRERACLFACWGSGGRGLPFARSHTGEDVEFRGLVVVSAIFEQVRAIRKHASAKPGQPSFLTPGTRYLTERLAEQIEACLHLGCSFALGCGSDGAVAGRLLPLLATGRPT